jgi:hypothetical protein
VTGTAADEMATATRAAERIAQAMIAREGERAFAGRGLVAVQAAIRTYRTGGSVTGSYSLAWLALALISLRIRDDAWARMAPGFSNAHRQLWAGLVRRAQPGYVAGPASLLAFTAWQCGDGAVASIALDRALADVPGYSMALLVREALDTGLPPAMAVLPMTPAEVAASYPEPPAAGRP